MRALVYHGPGKRSWEDRPRPAIVEAVQPKALVTHRFTLDDAMNAYDTFGRAAEARALEVILRAE